MSEFTTRYPEATVTDPYKRVRYQTGMVLGVDEFQQEQAYLVERDRLLTRALHGYGTVHGLSVRREVRDDGTVEVTVEPGMAIDPCGQHVCLDRAQCAVIDDWIRRRESDLVEGMEEGEEREVCLAVVLEYGVCETDFVPVPGGPCRSAEESRVASRMADDARVRFELEPDRPPHAEDRAIRLFGRLIRSLAEVDPSGSVAGQEVLEELVARLADLSTAERPEEVTLEDLAAGDEEREALDLPWETGEEDGPRVPIARGTRRELVDGLLDAWVRSARPRLLGIGSGDDPLRAGGCGPSGCHPVSGSEDGVVLGTICLTLRRTAEGLERVEEGSALSVDFSGRPVLQSTRLLQERIGAEERFERAPPEEGGDGDDGFAGAEAGGDLTGTYPDPRIGRLQDQALDVEADGDPVQEGDPVLTFRDDTWIPAALPALEGEAPPPPQPEPSNAEEGLTRITGISWRHGEQIGDGGLSLSVGARGTDEDARDLPALAVCFGREAIDPEGTDGSVEVAERHRVEVSSVTEEVFSVFASVPTGRQRAAASFTRAAGRGGVGSVVEILPRAVLPLVEVRVDDEGRITGGVVEAGTDRALGLLFVFPETVGARVGNAVRMDVVVRGDALEDAQGRAVDAEFVRGQLPTGDRRSPDSNVGVQGGRFESWIYGARRATPRDRSAAVEAIFSPEESPEEPEDGSDQPSDGSGEPEDGGGSDRPGGGTNLPGGGGGIPIPGGGDWIDDFINATSTLVTRFNEAAPNDLRGFYGVGPQLAGRIRAYIDEEGGIQDLSELENVPGVSARMIERWKAQNHDQ